jgi:hypothetical protein
VTILAWSLGLVLAVLGLLHIAWAFGGLTGDLPVVPERDGMPLFRPSRGTTLGVALLLLAAAILVAQQGGVLPYLVPAQVATLGSWTIALTFTARAVGEFRYVGLFKRVRGTRFARWDTRLFSPLCLAIGIGTAVIASR